MLTALITFIIVLAILVFVHELGHFVAAKKFGAGVEEFGIGFPPRIYSKVVNGTRYSLNWIPLGGFVKIKGESGEDKDDPDSFANKKAWKRAIILVAGVFMNMVLAFVIFSVGYMIGLPQGLDDVNPQGANIRNEQISFVSVSDKGPAAIAGLQSGDILVDINDTQLTTLSDVQTFISDNQDQELEFTVLRNEEETNINITPLYNEELNKGIIGVGLVRSAIVSYPIHLAIYNGFITTVDVTKTIVVAFYDLLKNAVTRQETNMEVTGPIGIAVLTGEVASLGFIYVLHFMAILSIHLAIINIFPFPALDGGRLLFLIIEKIRRKPVDQKIEAIVHNIGFALLMILILVVTFKDIAKYGAGFLNGIKGIIGL